MKKKEETPRLTLGVVMSKRQEEVEQGKVTTTSGRIPTNPEPGAPEPIDPRTGQHTSYWILSESERAKGFVRPVRRSYVHVGTAGPKYPLRDLTEDEKERYTKYGYVKYESYPKSESSTTGSFWTQERLDNVGKGCGVLTSMGQSLAETYARDPLFYTQTFCCGCGTHIRVGSDGEFVWDGTDERVGT